ncbi:MULTISPECIES: hypothetical protein [Meiothermus]|jgi:hypothetical protein|uniref:Uncharacterized protein n=1 Tax=Meiothermus hypogaeus NBRC 106114 TaxID=1227553 RepID=A0A511R1G8_9DEIN|nr:MULTISPECIES: hypothetical protein [Meiothermus]GAO74221.1 putative uncharacterized protein [Meiothermus ruber H328]GEM83137.1 hypothetical protein MHY01S_13030 [Meiothermus hypogaeus NBRC 106114]
MNLEPKEFWRMLENATWVVWDETFRYCLVGLPGEGYRLYRYERNPQRASLLADGEEAARIARAMGVEDVAA